MALIHLNIPNLRVAFDELVTDVDCVLKDRDSTITITKQRERIQALERERDLLRETVTAAEERAAFATRALDRLRDRAVVKPIRRRRAPQRRDRRRRSTSRR